MKEQKQEMASSHRPLATGQSGWLILSSTRHVNGTRPAKGAPLFTKLVAEPDSEDRQAVDAGVVTVKAKLRLIPLRAVST
jgi:hypothetical protein